MENPWLREILDRFRCKCETLGLSQREVALELRGLSRQIVDSLNERDEIVRTAAYE